MAHVYKITIKTQADKTLLVVADDAELAKTKIPQIEGESIANVEDQGEVIV